VPEVVFDRGTVLVRGGAPPPVPGLLWDPRVAAWRAPACLYPQVSGALRASGFEFEDRVPGPAAIPQAAGPPLRPYQEEALGAWEVAGRRGVIALPTGAGKTVVAIAAIVRGGRAAIVLVPTRVLLAQWVARLREALPFEPGVIGDGERRVEPVTVCTFDSAWLHMDSFGDRFGLVVVDEAHHFASGRGEALETCAAAWRLGLTGTPPGDDERSARLAELIGPVVFRMWVRDLSGSHLAPLRRVVRGVELDPAERAAYESAYGPFVAALRAFARTTPGGTFREFIRAACASEAGRALVAGRRAAGRVVSTAAAKLRLLRDLLREHRDERVIAFTADNAAAYAVSRELLVPALTCHVSRSERERLLELFRDGAVRALVSARILNEGIDVPEAGVGVVTGGSMGKREHAQRIGRLLRPLPGKTARLYELFARRTFEDREPARRMRGVLFPEE